MSITKYLNFKVLGYLILAYAGIAFLGARTGTIQGIDSGWYNNLIVTILAGLGSLFLDGQKVTFANVFAKILSYFKTNNQPAVTNDVFDALSEITATLKKVNDTEGVAMCKALNSHLFDAMYSTPEKMVVNNEEVK